MPVRCDLRVFGSVVTMTCQPAFGKGVTELRSLTSALELPITVVTIRMDWSNLGG